MLMAPRSTISIVRNATIRAPVVAALGTFDGIHIGHQELLKAVVARATELGAEPAVISFYPHPLVGLGRVSEMPAITNLRTKMRILCDLGIKYYIALRFRTIANLDASQFIQRIVEQYSVAHLVYGSDLRIGRGRDAGAEAISQLLARHGKGATVVPLLNAGTDKIGSRVIRALIEEGEIGAATSSLGRPYELAGRRVAGDHRGTSIGIPTVNLYAPRQVIPARGVYATTMRYCGGDYPSVTNVGNRPTFGGTTRSIETHALDVTINCPVLSRVQLFFHDRIRSEMKFNGVEELIAQIKRDCNDARERIRKIPKNLSY